MLGLTPARNTKDSRETHEFVIIANDDNSVVGESEARSDKHKSCVKLGVNLGLEDRGSDINARNSRIQRRCC